jgi:hypothetical protein
MNDKAETVLLCTEEQKGADHVAIWTSLIVDHRVYLLSLTMELYININIHALSDQ